MHHKCNIQTNFLFIIPLQRGFNSPPSTSISKQNASGKMTEPSLFTGPKHIIPASPTSYVIPMNCVHTLWQKQLQHLF